MIKKKNVIPYIFVIPSLLFAGLFFYYPVVTAITDSFTDFYKLNLTKNFIGLSNYIELFKNPIFFASVKNQLILTVTDVFKSLFFPLVAAEILYFIRNRRIADSARFLFIVPMLIPGLVITMMWRNIYDSNFGALNNILDLIGLGNLKHAWLYEGETALASVIFMGFPFVAGMNFLIMYTGLSRLKGEMEEAARIDGCKTVQIIRYIHIPIMVTYFNIITILTIINSLNDYVRILVTTRGGPGIATFIPSLYMYVVAFQSNRMGYACAMGVVIFIFILLLTMISKRVNSEKTGY